MLSILFLLACATDDGDVRQAPPGAETQSDTDVQEEASDTEASSDTEEEVVDEGDDTGLFALDLGTASSCDLGWDAVFDGRSGSSAALAPAPVAVPALPGHIAHAEPEPPYLWKMAAGLARGSITMPGYSDDMPLYERAAAFDGKRCYELPSGSRLMDEEDAWELFRLVAERTTGQTVDDTPGVRTVVGIRGAYPGTFTHNGDAPNFFNDTLVLIWRDEDDGSARVREFPVNTGTGSVDFGEDSSSSLWPNRRYQHANGWHRSYNALQIQEYGYTVWDDDNANGHWDDDRNGWLAPTSETDHERAGSGHNIHAASVGGPLGQAEVDSWSAGCQTIPGMDNWTAFIEQAWTNQGDDNDYFLVDVRDIPEKVWDACPADGTHDCPYEIDALPFSASGDTRTSVSDDFDVYNCSTADESGAEDVYVLTLDDYGTLTAAVDCEDDVDVDVHILSADDPDACFDRGHWEASAEVGPGRWFVIVDTWADESAEYAGAYSLTVALD